MSVPISSVDNYVGATKQLVGWSKTASRTTIANSWFSCFDLAGDPGAGTLAAGNTANGIVPTDATAGYPGITGGAGNTHICRVEYSSTVACRVRVFDRIFVAGAYAFNANQALSSQPSFAARVPNSDYRTTEIWVETVTAATGNLAVNVTYTDQDGNAGATTGATGIGAAQTLGRCWQLPFAAGDSGCQLITNIAGSVATVGTFNVMVLRPLWFGRVFAANFGDVHDILRTGMPRIYNDTSLYVMIAPDSTSTGIPDLNFELATG